MYLPFLFLVEFAPLFRIGVESANVQIFAQSSSDNNGRITHNSSGVFVQTLRSS